jgi:mRNA-degrading endonuclease toxin of MazEF toxin-antitoxin module
MTRDPLGQLLHSVMVGPFTSPVRGLSTKVALSESDGVRRSSVVDLDHLELVPRARLVRRVGRTTPDTLSAIRAAATETIG